MLIACCKTVSGTTVQLLQDVAYDKDSEIPFHVPSRVDHDAMAIDNVKQVDNGESARLEKNFGRASRTLRLFFHSRSRWFWSNSLTADRQRSDSYALRAMD